MCCFLGVVPHFLKLLLHHIIDESGYISLQLLNELINNHCYGYSEISTKPNSIYIATGSDYHIKQKGIYNAICIQVTNKYILYVSGVIYEAHTCTLYMCTCKCTCTHVYFLCSITDEDLDSSLSIYHWELRTRR